MKRFAMFIAFFAYVGIYIATAQNVQITGTVVSSEDGQPLPGASVMVKGTSIGTTTDFQGKYSLSVPSDAKVLIINFVGLKAQEVEIGGRTVIDAKLEADVQALSEVVVTALNIRKPEKALGYAATNITNDELNQGSDRSALNALQGKVAGVNISSSSGQPGASTRIIMRGYSSLSGSNQPLFIVDGMPISNVDEGAGGPNSSMGSTDINNGTDFGNRVNDINPEDIESINIIKGASGTALYGSRASNGVIIITTKKGQNRQGKGALVEVASSVTFSNPLRTPLFQNDFGQGWYDGTLAANLEENGSWGPKFDGKMRVWGHVLDNQQLYKPYVGLPDNFKDFFETGKNFNNTVSITNGNENSSYFLSYGNVNSNGILPTNSDSYDRNTVSFRGSSKFLKNFTSSASINYVNKRNRAVPTGQEQSVMDGLYQLPRDISIVDQKDYNNIFNNVDNYFTVFAQNPYYVLNEHGARLTENRVYGNISFDYQPLSWLTATFRAGTDVSNSQTKEWRAIVNSIRADYEDWPGNDKEGSFFNQEITTDFILSINKSITKDINLTAVFGQNFDQHQVRNQTAEVTGLNIPYFYQLSNSAAMPDVYEFSSKRRIVGVYSSIDVSYKNFLYVNFTGRNDWSSTLPANHRSYFYPSGSASFVFSELLPDLKDVLTFGKIRIGSGTTGHDADPYLTENVFAQAGPTDGYRYLNFPLPASGVNVNAFTVSNVLGNPDLKPEFTTENEIGTDLRFFNDRFKTDLTLYDRVTTDLIWNVTLPRSTGYASKTMNIGKMSNSGIELLLSAIPIRTKDFSWEISWNYTRNMNKVNYLTDGLDQVSIPNSGTSALGFVARPGLPAGLYEGSVVERDPKGRIVVNSQGLPVVSPQQVIYGSSQYDFMDGFSTLFTFKGLSLSATVDWRQGGMMYSRTREMMYFTGNAPNTTYNDRQPFIIPNSVQQLADGTYVENTTPIVGSNNNLNLYYNQTYGASDFQKAFTVPKTFVKLRQVVLSYKLPRSVIGHTFLQSVEFSLIGSNLLIWTPKDNTFIDPEETTFGNDLGADYGEYGAIPSTRSYGLSVKLAF